MAELRDYIVDVEYLSRYGLKISDPSLENNEAPLIEEAYQELLDYVFFSNDELDKTETAIYDYLVDDTDGNSYDKINGFKRAQYLVLRNLLTSELNPITDEVIACLSGRCGLIKRNGWQKN